MQGARVQSLIGGHMGQGPRVVQHRLDEKAGHIYTMQYYSVITKNAFESVLMGWMNLEPIIQSEVGQKEKHQYSILTHIYGI